MQDENALNPQKNTSIESRLARLEDRFARIENKAKPIHYQGWSSYEAWVISLWMDHDVERYSKTLGRAKRHLVEAHGDKSEAAIGFAQEIEEEITKGIPSYARGVYADLLTGALAAVNYHEIAAYHLSDVDEAFDSIKEAAKPPKSAKAVESRSNHTLTATPEILDILRRSTIDDEGLTLPPEQLPRDEYEAVNKFLDLAGAKWNKSKGRHLFKSGARAKIEALLDSGAIEDEKKKFQAFYTPAELAAELVELAGIDEQMTVLEPSAGAGAIAEAVRAKGASVRCIEMNPEAAKELESKGLAVEVADFLTVTPSPSFDRVTMNPPFTGDQDIKHVRHALEFLKPGGKLFAIMSPGFTFGGNKTRTEFKSFVAEHGRVVKDVAAGAFKESGTGVKTVIVELNKPAAPDQPSLFPSA